MPADYIYSTRKGDAVYHVFFGCSEAVKIKKKHMQFGLPPSDDQRRLCDVCESEMRGILG